MCPVQSRPTLPPAPNCTPGTGKDGGGVGVHGFNPAGAVGSRGLAAVPTLPQCQGHGDKLGDTRGGSSGGDGAGDTGALQAAGAAGHLVQVLLVLVLGVVEVPSRLDGGGDVPTPLSPQLLGQCHGGGEGGGSLDGPPNPTVP